MVKSPVNPAPILPNQSTPFVNPSAASNGFLSKPARLYAEENLNQSANPSAPSNGLHNSVHLPQQGFEMSMVVKENYQPLGENAPMLQPNSNTAKQPEMQENAITDESEALHRRAMERIAKLRNLSFNINGTDPNNEFETVPAYLRRNTELAPSIADVESFYSNYTVKSGEGVQTEISTINSFLEGKKPD